MSKLNFLYDSFQLYDYTINQCYYINERETRYLYKIYQTGKRFTLDDLKYMKQGHIPVMTPFKKKEQQDD